MGLASWKNIFWTWWLFKMRMTAILFNWGEDSFPLRLRIRFLFQTVLRFIFLPVWIFLWSIDEIFYGGYRSVSVDDCVWVVSTPRTGSSNLTEALLCDERDFLCPRMTETVFPFICINRCFDFLEWFFGLFGIDIIKVLTSLLMKQNAVDDDALDHHPMGLYSASQPEHVHLMWLNISPPAQFSFPDPEYWINTALFDRLDKHTYDRMHELRKICLQKVAYRRGRGRRMVFKAHSSEDLENMVRLFPKAVFVVGSRRPSEQIPSVMKLSNSFQMSQSGTSCFTKGWYKKRLEFLDVLWRSELDFFKNIDKKKKESEGKEGGERGEDDKIPHVLHVPFHKFMKNPDVVIKEMLEITGVVYEGDDYLKESVGEYVRKHQEYKGKRKYQNPPLSFFGLNKEELDERYAEYNEYFNL